MQRWVMGVIIVLGLIGAGIIGMQLAGAFHGPVRQHVEENTGKVSEALPVMRGIELKLGAGKEWDFKTMQAVGANWVAVGVEAGTPVSDQVKAAVAAAQGAKMKVCLVIHSAGREPGGKKRLEEWEAKWVGDSVAAARAAQEMRVDLLVAGYRLDEWQEDEEVCRAWVKEIRNVYDGPVCYAADGGSYGEVSWWDAVDVIGVAGNVGLTDAATATPERVESGWVANLRSIESLGGRYGKKAILVGVGYAAEGSGVKAGPTVVRDAEAREMYLGRALAMTRGRETVEGIFIKEWTDGAEGAYAVNGKEMLQVLADGWRNGK